MNIFNALSTPESLWLLLFLFVSFLIGFITAWLMRGRTVRRLREQVKKYEIDLEALNREHNDLKEKYGLQEADLKRLQLEYDNQREKNHTLEAEKGQLFADLYGAKASLEELQNNYSFATEKLGTKQLEIEKTTAQLNEAESEKSQLFSEIEALKAGAGAAIVSATTDRNDDERVVALETSLTEMQNVNDALRKEMDAISDEKTKIEEDLRAAQTDLNATKAELNNANASMATEAAEREVSPEESAVTAATAFSMLLGGAIPKAGAEELDDLKLINGVGPFLERKLNDVGVFTFEQISKMDGNAINLVTEAIQFFPGRIDKDNWVGQAKDLMNR